MITETQFEEQYARNSGTTIDKLHELGLFAVPCDCEQEGCEGWAMMTKENIKTHSELYIMPPAGK